PCRPVFPYTTLFRSLLDPAALVVGSDDAVQRADEMLEEIFVPLAAGAQHVRAPEEHVARPVPRIVRVVAGELDLAGLQLLGNGRDRKSTRLNSSHVK